MKVACIAFLIVALVLTALGLFGITDYLISLPGWEAAKKDAAQGGPPGSLAAAHKDLVDSQDRARSIGLVFSLLCFAGGLGLGVWASRTYRRRRALAGVAPGRDDRFSATAVCSICGARLSPVQNVRGLCDACWKRAS